jgi:hypothetical protein
MRAGVQIIPICTPRSSQPGGMMRGQIGLVRQA